MSTTVRLLIKSFLITVGLIAAIIAVAMLMIMFSEYLYIVPILGIVIVGWSIIYSELKYKEWLKELDNANEAYFNGAKAARVGVERNHNPYTEVMGRLREIWFNAYDNTVTAMMRDV